MLVIFELKDIFYQSVHDDGTKKQDIEKMGRVANYTIEKKIFSFMHMQKLFLKRVSRMSLLTLPFGRQL